MVAGPWNSCRVWHRAFSLSTREHLSICSLSARAGFLVEGGRAVPYLARVGRGDEWH